MKTRIEAHNCERVIWQPKLRAALSMMFALLASSCTPPTERVTSAGYEIEICGARVSSTSLAPMEIETDQTTDDPVPFYFRGEPKFDGTLNCKLYIPQAAFSRDEIQHAVEGVSRNGGLAHLPLKGGPTQYALRLQPEFNVDSYLEDRTGASICLGTPSENLRPPEFNLCVKQVHVGGGVFAEVQIYKEMYSGDAVEEAVKANLKGVKE